MAANSAYYSPSSTAPITANLVGGHAYRDPLASTGQVSMACLRSLSCGHKCLGLQSDGRCMPCLYGCTGAVTASDICVICHLRLVRSPPCIQLACRHIFHMECVRTMLRSGWPGPAISFEYCKCPLCKAAIEHPALRDDLQPVKELQDAVSRQALQRLDYEGLSEGPEIVSPYSEFYKNRLGFALRRYEFYQCFRCKKAYFGGDAMCVDLPRGPATAASEYVCGECIGNEQGQACAKHGTEYLEFKCRFCCTTATFFCFGTTHFCKVCHDNHAFVTALQPQQLPQCPAGPKATKLAGSDCPLHVSHARTGQEFILGCGLCPGKQRFWKA